MSDYSIINSSMIEEEDNSEMQNATKDQQQDTTPDDESTLKVVSVVTHEHLSAASLRDSCTEVTIIDNVTSYLEANGAAGVDERVLRNMAEALARRMNDTSPGTLQDVTMDTSYGIGYRSPCVSLQQYQGSTSPATQGRSVREFEEQMATLRKENFNLKLRLYFIEESIPGYKQADGQETLMKQLIDTKVEMEILRKEIQEKQEILKEAAQAMTQMERIQKDTEEKSQAIVDELNQKIQYLEMERDMEKTQNGEFMNDLLGRSDISENINAIQKIRELEGVVKQSDDKINDFQAQITKLDEILSKRDETIKEYEEKVKELVFQNAELQEALENKEREISCAERTFRGLRKSNVELREENENLVEALRTTREHFRKEMSNMKMCERQICDQQETLSKMQSTISIKTANTARLLERIQEYEKMVTKMNFERNLADRENRFFRAIIQKLQSTHINNNSNECYTIEQEEIYQQIGSDYSSDRAALDAMSFDTNFHEVKARGDFHGEYKLKQKLCVNFNNASKFAASSCAASSLDGVSGLGQYGDGDDDDDDEYFEPEVPIRYTFSDGNMYAANNGGGCGGGGVGIGGGNSVVGCCIGSNVGGGGGIVRGGKCGVGCVVGGVGRSSRHYSTVDCCLCDGDDGDSLSKSNSCSSLQPNYSSSSFLAGREISEDLIMKSQSLRAELQEQRNQLADKSCMLQDVEEQLKQRVQIHEHACRTIQQMTKGMKQQRLEINRLKSNATHASKSTIDGGVTTESLELGCSLSDLEDLEMTPGEKQQFVAKIAEQETLIAALKAEVKKKTANLQNLVNKELWEKNREIERLTKLMNNKSASSALSPLKDATNTAAELQHSFSDSDYLKALERNKLLQKKVDILIQRLGVDRSNDSLLTKLRNDVREARSDADKSEKWRRECADVCAVLSNRLEELAGFLNSLLKHKDVLCVLAADRRHAMRRAVDRSLDLSKSLNMTLSMSGDQSFLQLSHLCDQMLGDDNENVAATAAFEDNKTFDSHLAAAASSTAMQPSVETLIAENKALRRELSARRSTEAFGGAKKERRSLPIGFMDTPQLQHNNNSESEAWSEPDRKVSLARIGLKEQSPKRGAAATVVAGAGAAGACKATLDTDSDSEAALNSRSAVAAAAKAAASATRIAQLEQQLRQRDERILDIQCQLVDADNKLKQQHLRSIDTNAELQQLRTHNEELNADLLAIGGVAQDLSVAGHNQSVLVQQLDATTRALDKLQDERDRLAQEARQAETQLQETRKHLEASRAHKHELYAEAQEKYQTAKLQHEQQIEVLRQHHEEVLARDYVTQAVHEKLASSVQTLQQQLGAAERNITELLENEHELKQTLVDNELAQRAIKKQLDESTLQASKAVLERTKALNDKLQLERSVQQLQQQLQQHQEERAALQCRIRELETAQQQLVQQHQQQLQQQSLRLQSVAATKLAASGSDATQSGYTSEELPLPAGAVSAATAAAGGSRLHNSSPDLGIESDAGRVSSVELSSAQQQQFMRVGEVVKMENNQLSVKEENTNSTAEQQLQLLPQNPQPAATHDCAKVDQENAELRRKLIRTKRAFEETYQKLHIANQRKAQIEKDIKNQILKTNNVLRNVRSNMENEL